MHSALKDFLSLLYLTLLLNLILLALHYLMSHNYSMLFSENQICQRTEMFQLKVRKHPAEKNQKKKYLQTGQGKSTF